MPSLILEKISADLRAAVDSPEFAARMLPLGAEPKSSSPQELAGAICADIENWAAVAKAAGIRAE